MVIDIASITSKNSQATKATLQCCPAVSEAPLNRSNANRLAAAFAALGDPVRLRLFSLIASVSPAETCACALVKPTGRSQPTVSHHLKVLREDVSRITQMLVNEMEILIKRAPEQWHLFGPNWPSDPGY